MTLGGTERLELRLAYDADSRSAGATLDGPGAVAVDLAPVQDPKAMYSFRITWREAGGVLVVAFDPLDGEGWQERDLAPIAGRPESLELFVRSGIAHFRDFVLSGSAP